MLSIVGDRLGFEIEEERSSTVGV